MQLKIDVSEAVQELEALPDNIMGLIEANADYIGMMIETEQKMAATNTQTANRGGHGLTRHGNLANRIHYDHSETHGDQIDIINVSGASYAPFQEFGTGYKGDPYDYNGAPIFHTTKRSWAFHKDGQWHIGRPIPPRHFMQVGAETAADNVAEFLADIIKGELEQ